MRRFLSEWFGSILAMAIALAAVATATAATAQPRIALVVGNAAYPSRPLGTATEDAGLVAQALAQVGFDVTAAADLDGAQLAATFHAFAEKARTAGPDALVVVYLAGLGVQLDGNNYFAPIDARIEHAADAAREAVSLADLERALEGVPTAARILVYDLARDNAFAARDGMPLAPGLALATPPAGTLVAFDAAPGATAPDEAPPYGAYARAFAEMIGTPGLPVGVLFDRVRLRVGELTDGGVVPWNAGTIDDGLALIPSVEGAPRLTAGSIAAMPIAALSADIAYSAVIARDTFQGYTDFTRLFPNDPLAERIRANLAVRREALTWAAAVAADDPRAYWTYVRRYPRGPHLFDARRRLALLGASLEPPPRFDIFPFPDLPPPPPAELARQDAAPEQPPIPPPPGAFLPMPNGAYYDDLPPPGPAPAGVLPITAPLPLVAEGSALAMDGRIMQQGVPGHGSLATRTQFAAGGAATLTLAGGAGEVVARVATSVGPADTRTILQTGRKGADEARTTTTRDADGLTTTQTDAKGATILRIVARADRDGGRTTTVTDARGAVVAELRRDARGIVVARRVAEARPVTVAAPPALLLPPTPPPSGVPAAPRAAKSLPGVAPSGAQPAPVTPPPSPLRPTPKAQPTAPNPAPLVPKSAPPAAPLIPKSPPPAAPLIPKPAPPAGPPLAPPPRSTPAPATPEPPAPPPPKASPPAPPPPPPEPPRPPAPPAPAPSATAPGLPASPPLPPRRPASLTATAKKSSAPAHPAAKVKSGGAPKRRAGPHRR